MKPHSKIAQLIYIANFYNDSVDVYTQIGSNQSPIGSITDGISEPTGVAVSSTGDLYVASFCEIPVFHEGALHPFKKLKPAGPVFSLALTAKRVYASLEGTNSLINWFAPGATKPTGTLHDPNIQNLAYMTTNSHDDLIVNGTNSNGCNSSDGCGGVPKPQSTSSPSPCEIDLFPGGKQIPNVLRTDCTAPEGMGVDAKDELVFAQAPSGLLARTQLQPPIPQPTGSGGGCSNSTISIYAPPYNQPALGGFTICGFVSGIALRFDNDAIWALNNETNGSCCWFESAQEYTLGGGFLDQTSPYFTYSFEYGIAASHKNL